MRILVSILSFVDDGLLIAQSKSLSILNSLLFCSYNITSNLLTKFGLIMEQSKTEMFYFSRSFGAFNPPPLDLSALGGPILCPKETWQYLGFIFNRNYFFTNISIFMQIRWFWQSSIWRYSEIQCKVSSLIKNISYTGLAFSLSYYMASKCGFTTKLHYLTCWRSWEKYREGKPFRFLGHFKHSHHSALRLLQALFLSTFILRNLAADLNWELTLFQTTTSFDHYWNQGLTSQVILTAFPLVHLQNANMTW